MEVDTGAALSLISEETYNSLWANSTSPALQKSDAKLKSYTGEIIQVKGTIEVEVEYQDQKAKLPLTVVSGCGPSLLGRNWLRHLRLDWSRLHHITTENHKSEIQTIIDRHPDLFRKELGKVVSATAKIYVDEKSKPRFKRARQVPYALQSKVEAEIITDSSKREYLNQYSSHNGPLQLFQCSSEMGPSDCVVIIKSQ